MKIDATEAIYLSKSNWAKLFRKTHVAMVEKFENAVNHAVSLGEEQCTVTIYVDNDDIHSIIDDIRKYLEYYGYSTIIQVVSWINPKSHDDDKNEITLDVNIIWCETKLDKNI